MKFLRKFAAAAAELGPGNACFYATHLALAHLGGAVHRFYFIAQPVCTEPLLSNVRGRSIIVRQVPAVDPALRQMPLSPEVIQHRVAQQAMCFGAFKGDRMIGCLWLCLGPYREDVVRSSFVPIPAARTSWDFDVYLLPEYRLGLGFARLWDTANCFLRERGITWSISRISAYNSASLTAHARLGTRRIGIVTFVHLGRYQLTFSSVRPYVHLSLRPSSAPEFKLHAPIEKGFAPARTPEPTLPREADRSKQRLKPQN